MRDRVDDAPLPLVVFELPPTQLVSPLLKLRTSFILTADEQAVRVTLTCPGQAGTGIAPDYALAVSAALAAAADAGQRGSA